MKISLVSVQYDTFDIDFQKVFDFMKNKGELENTVYDYDTQFGDNADYYLNQIYGIVVSYQDINEYDGDEKTYPYSMNADLLDELCDDYYNWLVKNKEKLGLTEF